VSKHYYKTSFSNHAILKKTNVRYTDLQTVWSQDTDNQRLDTRVMYRIKAALCTY